MASALPLSSSSLAVGRARFSGPGASRALLEQALGAVALDRLGLGPEEVLYVPRLIGPTRLRGGETRHFANGLGLILSDMANRAERDPVGGSASDRPCRFSSRAAFAAWLIATTLDTGSAEAASMVRAATGFSSPQSWWRSEVLSKGRTLVPVLIRLAATGQAALWLSRLDGFELDVATAALARDYGLVLAAEPGVERDTSSHRVERRVASPVNRPDTPAFREARAAENTVLTAAQSLATRDSRFTALPLAARRLIVAAVILARAPSVPRDALARAIIRRIIPELPSATAPVPFPAKPQTDPVQTTPPPRPAPLVDHFEVPAGPTRRPTLVTSAAHPAITPVHITSRVQGPPTDPSTEEKVRVDRPLTDAIAPPVAAPAPQPSWNPYPEPQQAQNPLALVEPRAAFTTAFGGLAFLVNAFLAMGFYPDFTRPLDPALSLSPLALADRLGIHWFGARYRRDPLHHWIAQRGMHASLPKRWQVERDWLTPFAGGRAWHDGSTLWHAAGFPLANRSAATPARRLARRLGVVPVRGLAGRSARRASEDPDWLECLALFLAARFRRAAPDDALTPAMLAIPARAVVVEARLDVHFALSALPIALRLAGLDRDPGWLPSEGRDLRFHFE